jgi:carbon-monoxide dehydrogenase large subunit
MSAETRGSGSTWVGRSIRRVEDPALVAGAGRFTADLPASHWVRFVRSSIAAGRIENVIVPDGGMVITAKDLPGVKPIRPMLHKFNYIPVGQPILADQVVRFVGEPVAAVIAASQEEAEDLADQVELAIAATAAVTDGRQALEAGAPLVHAHVGGNIVVEGRFSTPDFATIRARGKHSVRLQVRTGRQNATPMETRGGHAVFDPASGRTTLTCTTQGAHLMRTAVADCLGIPESELRVIAPDVGGGFGQKMSLPPEYVLLVWLARRLRSSVAWSEDRRENLIAGFHSRDQALTLEGAFEASGKLMAISAEVLANVGAYSCYPTTAGIEPLMAMAEMPGPYDVRAYECLSRGVLTNTCPMAPYRGVSRPVLTFAIERLMDKAAAELNIDPIDIRRRNLVDKFPYTSATGLVFDEGTYQQTLEAAVKHVDLPAFRKRQQKAREQGRFIGVGFATFCERTGYGTPAFAARGMEITPGWETVQISMDPSGFVEARIGASPHGQGLHTTLAQIIADEIGVVPDRIRVVHGDTDTTPYGFGTFAARSLVICGGASMLAARKIGTKLTKIASHILEAAPEDIVLKDGQATVAGTDRTIGVEILARAAYHQAHRFKGEVEPGLSESATYDPAGTFSNACHVAVVDVDVETGGVKIERFVVVEDAGRIINPMIADGQVHGGIVQGMGNALLEEIIYDSEGNILTSTLADYLPPTVGEVPMIELHHMETLTDASVTKAKGLGEGGAIGPPGAIINAINDALTPFGVALDEIPATPMRIRAALRGATRMQA